MHIDSFDLMWVFFFVFFFVGQSAFFKVVERKHGAHDDAFQEMKVHISADPSSASRGAIIKTEPEDFVGFFFFFCDVWHNVCLQDDQSVSISMPSQRESEKFVNKT